MYDWELHNYLRERNYDLNHNEYLYVCNDCPQLIYIKYNPYEDCFESWSNNNEYFRFKVRYIEGI